MRVMQVGYLQAAGLCLHIMVMADAVVLLTHCAFTLYRLYMPDPRPGHMLNDDWMSVNAAHLLQAMIVRADMADAPRN